MTGLLRPVPRRLRGVALILPFAVLIVAGVLYTGYVQRQADHRWCALISILDEQYQSTPPQSEVGRRFAAAMHQLYDDLDC